MSNQQIVILISILIWPVFFALLILFYKGWINNILHSIKTRIDAGGPVRIGNWLSFGSAPVLEPPSVINQEQNQQNFVGNRPVKNFPRKKISRRASYQEALYLVHSVQPTTKKTPDGLPYYNIRIQLHSLISNFYQKVDQVTYYLHESWRDPIVTSRSRSRNFQIEIDAWGQFNLRAVVSFRDSSEELELRRFLNF